MLSFSQKLFFAIMLEELTHILDMVQVFDKHNRGYISASDLRAVLQCLGEDLSEEESK
jgi:Ca2+-binding EF-hand superfamily protein